MSRSTADSAPSVTLPTPKERRRLREALALSEEQVAEAMGVTKATVKAWETGRSTPRGRKREAYAKLLGSHEPNDAPSPERPHTQAQARPGAQAQAQTEPHAQAETEPQAQAQEPVQAQVQESVQAQAQESVQAQVQEPVQAQVEPQEQAQAQARVRGTQAQPQAQDRAEPQQQDQTQAQPQAQERAQAGPQAQAEAREQTQAQAQTRPQAEAQVQGAPPQPQVPARPQAQAQAAPWQPQAQAQPQGRSQAQPYAPASGPAPAPAQAPAAGVRPKAAAKRAAKPPKAPSPSPAITPGPARKGPARPQERLKPAAAEARAPQAAGARAPRHAPQPAHAPRPTWAAEPAGPPAVPGLTPEEAFDALYAQAAPGLVHQTYLLTGRRRLSQESVDYAFHHAWEHWPEVAVDADPVGWVRATAYEYALSPWHRLRRAHKHPDPPPAEANRRALLTALLELPPAYRRTVLLYDGLGLDLPETAAETEASTPAAANRLLHARTVIGRRIPELAEPEDLHRRLTTLVTEAPTAALPAARTVRSGSERRSRTWTRAVLGVTAVLIGVTGFTAATAPTRYIPVNAPGETVNGVPVRGGPQKLRTEDLELRDKLRSGPNPGPERLIPAVE
ncbi:sigma factor-like helix-turn-helix DNA-binding protein [Streptomyces zaomyceticus]|uniref:sigma factor-like helix-turn-helix DNA-binding protein n=1 Tax=Streptomyces zaomyceticus TaxID=68286 RepID=UPI00372264A6